MESVDVSEVTKTRQSLVINFVTSYNSLKSNFILYNTLLNRLKVTHGDDYNAERNTDEDNRQMGQLINQIQYFLMDCDLYYSAICDKINYNKEKSEELLNLIKKIQGDFVPNRKELYEVIKELTSFIADKIATDLLNSEVQTVQGALS